MAGKPKPLTNGEIYLPDKGSDAYKKRSTAEMKEIFGEHAGKAMARSFQESWSRDPDGF